MPKKTLLTVLLILILTGPITATGIYIGKKLRQHREESSIPPSAEPEEITPETTPTEPRKVDTSDWKIYRNEKYGFEMKYPKSWSVLEVNDLHVSFQSSLERAPELHLSIIPNSKRIAIGACLEEKFDYSPKALSTLKPMDVDNLVAYYIEEPGFEGWYRSIFIPKDEVILQLTFRPIVKLESINAFVRSFVSLRGE